MAIWVVVGLDSLEDLRCPAVVLFMVVFPVGNVTGGGGSIYSWGLIRRLGHIVASFRSLFWDIPAL